MSNPDVPGIEACRRLGEAGWPQEDSDYAWVATFGSQETGGWFLCQGLFKHFSNKRMAVAAPTIGEMLAEIRRRGWQVSLATVGPLDVCFKATVWRADGDGEGSQGRGGMEYRRVILGHMVADSPADALALALAEAGEKERDRP